MADDSISEEWRAIKGRPGYEVSNLGRVRSLDRTVTRKGGGLQRARGRILRPALAGKYRDYWSGCLGRGQHVNWHVLVCEAFRGPRPSEHHEVSHIDGNSQNNRADNLEWATKAENESKKTAHGTKVSGSRHGRSVLDEAAVAQILMRLAAGEARAAIARSIGMDYMTVSHIHRGKTWKHVPRPWG